MGSKSSAKEKLEELIECLICQERMKLATMLPCQHELCLDCLGKYVASKVTVTGPNGALKLKDDARGSNGKLSIHCPKCQRVVTLDKISDVDRSLKFGQIMDTDLLEKNTVTAKCKLCGFKPIEFECTNCETSCCGSCLDLEKCKKKKHFVGKINDPETISCILHDLELTYFCETCKILICFDCFLEHNAEHQIKMFSHACDELIANLEKSMSLAFGNMNDAEDILKMLQIKIGLGQNKDVEYLKTLQSEINMIFDEAIKDLTEKMKISNELGKIKQDATEIYEKGKMQTVAAKKFKNYSILKYKEEAEKNIAECNAQEIMLQKLKRYHKKDKLVSKSDVMKRISSFIEEGTQNSECGVVDDRKLAKESEDGGEAVCQPAGLNCTLVKSKLSATAKCFTPKSHSSATSIANEEMTSSRHEGGRLSAAAREFRQSCPGLSEISYDSQAMHQASSQPNVNSNVWLAMRGRGRHPRQSGSNFQ